jgi:uncharacterized membrane protein
MPYCRKCGRRLRVDAESCPKCGTSVFFEIGRAPEFREPKVRAPEVREPEKSWRVPIGVQLTITGVFLVIFGAWLKGQYYVRSETRELYGIPYTIPTSVTSLEPYGWLLIAIGVAVTILGIWKWSSQKEELISESKEGELSLEEILDVLEKRRAEGKISEATYQKMLKKYEKLRKKYG